MAPALGAAAPTGDRYRRAHRPADLRILGGVAAGLSDHLSIPVVWVRVGFVVATWFNGAGLIAYLMLWRFLPMAEPERCGEILVAEAPDRIAPEPAHDLTIWGPTKWTPI